MRYHRALERVLHAINEMSAAALGLEPGFFTRFHSPADCSLRSVPAPPYPLCICVCCTFPSPSHSLIQTGNPSRRAVWRTILRSEATLLTPTPKDPRAAPAAGGEKEKREKGRVWSTWPLLHARVRPECECFAFI